LSPARSHVMSVRAESGRANGVGNPTRNREESTMNDLCTKGAGELAGMIASRRGHIGRGGRRPSGPHRGDQPGRQRGDRDTGRRGPRAAAAIDQAVAAGAPLGPLAGVPFTIKENHRHGRVCDDLGRQPPSPSRSPRPTLRWSCASGRPAPSRSPARACRTSRSAGTPLESRLRKAATSPLPNTGPLSTPGRTPPAGPLRVDQVEPSACLIAGSFRVDRAGGRSIA